MHQHNQYLTVGQFEKRKEKEETQLDDANDTGSTGAAERREKTSRIASELHTNCWCLSLLGSHCLCVRVHIPRTVAYR